MKAALLEQAGRLEVRDVPEPPLGDYDARCEMLYGATCSGTDLHLMMGRLNWALNDAPTILGHESIGRVIEVGPKVRNYKVGDLVSRVSAPPLKGQYGSTWGGYAERGVALDHWAMVEDGLGDAIGGSTVNQLIPADFDPRACTMIITWRETLSYITRMGIGAGHRVLVVGSGGNGLSFAAHSVNRGAAEVVMYGNGTRAEAAAKVGVTRFVDYRDDDAEAQLKALTGDGFDFVVDSIGKVTVTDLACGALKTGGTIGIYGIDDMGKVRINPGAARGTFTFAEPGYDEAEAHEAVIQYMKDGKLDASVWMDLDKVYSLDEINDALAAVADRKAIKVLVKLSDNG